MCGMCVKSSTTRMVTTISPLRSMSHLDATQAGDGVVFKDYRVGFAEDLLGEW